MEEKIIKPKPFSRYTDPELFYQELDILRFRLCEKLGVSAEELHAIGPDAVEMMLGSLSVKLTED